MFRKAHNWLYVLLIVCIIGASSWALFRPEFFRFHDFTQGARIVEMTHALKAGHIPPIWSSNLGFGYGMPLFEFYAPLPYYLGSLLYMFGFSLIDSIKLIMLISSVVTAVGAYFLGKKLFGSFGGIVTSAAITLAPYRAVNLFVRGAISEAWGILFLPLILLGIIKTIKNERFGWVLLLFSITGLLLSHNLTALVFLPFSVIFGAGYLFLELKKSKHSHKRALYKILQLMSMYLIALLLSAYYTIPALLEKDFTLLESIILAEYFNYRLHFVGLRQFLTENWGYGGSTYGIYDGISFYLGFGQLFGLLFSGLVVLRSIKSAFQKGFSFRLIKIDYNTALYLLFLLLFGVSLLMSTARFQFVWEFFPPLEFLQFPWRYLSATIVFLGLVVGSLSLILPNRLFKVGYGSVIIILIISMNSNYFRPEELTSDLGEYYYSDTNKLRTTMSITLPDYIPVQIGTKVIKPVALEGQVLYCQVIGDCFVNPEIIFNSVNKKIVAVSMANSSELSDIQVPIIFALADFPGWSATVDGKTVAVTQSPEGFVQVMVTPGTHVITLELKSTKVRKTASWSTLLGIGLFVILFFWYYKRK